MRCQDVIYVGILFQDPVFFLHVSEHGQLFSLMASCAMHPAGRSQDVAEGSMDSSSEP